MYTYIPEADFQEGAGSIFQREILARLVAINDGIPFVRHYQLCNPAHEGSLNSRHIAAYVWNNIFSISNEIPLDMYINGIGSNIRNIKFQDAQNTLSNMNTKQFDNLVSEFRDQFIFHNKDLILDCRMKFSGQHSIGLHLRNYSSGDSQIGEMSLPWEIFSEDYGLPNQNNMFYAHYYSAICFAIKREHAAFQSEFPLYIYSTGELNDFRYICNFLSRLGFQPKLHLNRPSYMDFIELISHTHMVCAKSSLSYIAGLCSRSLKYARKKGNRFLYTSDTILVEDNIVLQ